MLDFPNTRTRAIVFKHMGKGVFTFPKIYLMQRIVNVGDRVVTNLLLPGGGVDSQDVSVNEGLMRELNEELREPAFTPQMLHPCFNGNGIFIKRSRDQFNEFEQAYFQDKLPADVNNINQLTYYWAMTTKAPLSVNPLEAHKFSGIGLYSIADIDNLRRCPLKDLHVNFDIPSAAELNAIYDSL